MVSSKTATSWTSSVVVSAWCAPGEESCSNAFAAWNKLKDHRNDFHRDRVPCPDCSKVMKIKSLFKHRRNVHKNIWEAEQTALRTNPARFRCDICHNVSYKKERELAKHLKSKHSGIEL